MNRGIELSCCLPPLGDPPHPGSRWPAGNNVDRFDPSSAHQCGDSEPTNVETATRLGRPLPHISVGIELFCCLRVVAFSPLCDRFGGRVGCGGEGSIPVAPTRP